jgi:hypothetical protein
MLIDIKFELSADDISWRKQPVQCGTHPLPMDADTPPLRCLLPDAGSGYGQMAPLQTLPPIWTPPLT